MFCEQCGTRAEAQSKFCTKCGSLLSRAAEPTAAEPTPGAPAGGFNISESVAWVLPAQRKISFFKRAACYVAFMGDKAVVAHLSPQRQKEESANASQEIKEKGVGLFKGSAAMMQYWASYHKKYYSMTSAQILAEDPTNFVLSYQMMKKVVFQCESLTTDEEGRAYGSQGGLTFSMMDGNTIKFSHSYSHNKSYKETLVRLFNGKLKYKK